MDTVLNVKLWDKEVAAVAWNKDEEYATIEFYDSFAKEGLDIAPLIMPLSDIVRGDRVYSFPIHKGKTFKGLPGLLADSLPDDYGNKILDEWFASKGMSVNEFTPLDRLCYVGKRGMGALEYEPANMDAALNESTQVEIEQLSELAREVLNQRENFQASLLKGDKAIKDILKVGTSAGGAKPKAVIAYNETTKEVRSGQVKALSGFTYWLLKFDGVEDRMVKDNPKGIGKIEYAYYKMATACGILMTECRLLQEGEYAHFMTKRFDRTDSGEKLHTQTLCAIAHFDRDGRYSYEQAFQTMRKLYLPYDEMEQMYRRMVFNVVARNHDDHTKNHSFIMNQSGQWSLAPAYDLCYSYSPSGKWTSRHQMSLNNKRDDFTYDDLLAVSKKMNIKDGHEIIQHIVDTVSHWEIFAKDAGVKKDHINQISETLRFL
ncbi:toxin HipA [Bacteroidia bacterium]|nr:toxin HipA [Bacteroidia bacterium]